MKLIEKIIIYQKLIRFDKPVGWILLLISCWQAMLLAGLPITNFKYMVFAIGAFLMRSAGCIINDYFDQDFDKKVARTKERPLAAGLISNKEALMVAGVCCLVSLWLAISFLPKITILLSICWLPLVAIYPLAKRVTYFPQYVLGVSFNGGLIAYSSVAAIDYLAVLFFVANIFFICAFDTIYALSDYQDDKKAGVKSPVIFLGLKKTNIFIVINYIIYIGILNFIVSYGVLEFLLLITLIIYQLYLAIYLSQPQKAFKFSILISIVILFIIKY